METPPFTAQLEGALAARRELIADLDDTDCYRLFHGVAEGRPGLAVDRYGPLLLAQTWREPLTPADLEAVDAVLAKPEGLELHWRHRGEGEHGRTPADAIADPIGHELGVSYDVAFSHRGQDPLLFLDLRAVRRRVLALAGERTVLNLFAYSCGVGLCAAQAGAREVWNVDVAASALAIGRANARRNGIESSVMSYVQEDVLCIVRQLAGLPVGLRRGRKRKYRKCAPRQFDLTVLDPPRWARGPFGAVDVARDYPSLFKPALLATVDGGTVIATNHDPEVEQSAWHAILERAAAKAGRPLKTLETIEPEADFPSFDGYPPLKVALIGV